MRRTRTQDSAMEKILITGVSGFLGWNLAQTLRHHYHVYGTYLDHQIPIPAVELIAFDFTQLDKIEKLLEVLQPQAIVHAAAFSNPDLCETQHKEALTLNTLATKQIARAANRFGSKLIYVSTDLVFDGEKGHYTEADSPAPINYYGKTKYLGELEVTNHSSYYAILRFSVLYGRGTGVALNLFETLEQHAKRGLPMRLFTDQYRTPLFIGDAVRAVERFLCEKSLKGLFHLGGPDRMSRYEFGVRFRRVFDLTPDFTIKSTIADARLPATRPKDCSLVSDKMIKTTGMGLTPVEQGLLLLLRTEAH